MKKFIKKLVADVKFSDAGRGHKLNEDRAPSSTAPSAGPSSSSVPRRPPSGAAQTAGNAALARLDTANNKQNSGVLGAQQLQMRRQIKRQASQEQQASVAAPQREPEFITQLGLRMLCPICSTSCPKPDISQHFESCLEKQLELDPLKTTCTMIHTLNKDEELLAVGIKTLVFFVLNVVKNPGEEKYKKIRVKNAGVQKKIMPLVGGVEFLELAGFTRINDETENEEYFVMLDEPPTDHLELRVKTLQESKRVAPTLDRDIKVLQTSVGSQRFEVSSDFYRVTKEDLQTEQRRRVVEAERGDMLRTKAMRDRDAGIGMRIYHYSIIRIRFPDGIFLQGTFSAHDTVESLFRFVESSLRHPVSFSLITPGCPPIKRDRTLLKAAGLVPSAVFNLTTPEKTEFTLLTDELVCKLADL